MQKIWSKSLVFRSWSVASLGEIKSLVLAELDTREIMEKFKFNFFGGGRIWSILPSVNKMCVWGPKTRNTFWVIAT